MTHIDRKIATKIGTAPHRYVTEASSLGMGPGHWPALITTDLGNGQDLVRGQRMSSSRGKFAGYTYAQANGRVVVSVYND